MIFYIIFRSCFFFLENISSFILYLFFFNIMEKRTSKMVILHADFCKFWWSIIMIVGQIPTGHLSTISVYSAKVTIIMVIISNHFGKIYGVHLLKY